MNIKKRDTLSEPGCEIRQLFHWYHKKSNYVEGDPAKASDLIHSKTLAIKVYAMAPGIKLVFQKSRARMHLSRLLVIGSRLFLHGHGIWS